MIDCFDESDEKNCNNLPIEYFQKHSLRQKCKIEYDTMNNIKTMLRFPDSHFQNCKNFKCEKKEYKCQFSYFCIPIEKVCDGINQCLNGDDEMFCGKKDK